MPLTKDRNSYFVNIVVIKRNSSLAYNIHNEYTVYELGSALIFYIWFFLFLEYYFVCVAN